MRQVREVLRLRTAGVGLNEIARRVGVAPSTVRLTLKRVVSAGLSWPLPAEMTETALETALFAAAGTKHGHRRHVEPDWAEIHRERKRKHVTLTMLWDEYIERCPEGYRYSRFCELYRSWALRLSVTMRQAHIGGDKLFVDYAGDTHRKGRADFAGEQRIEPTLALLHRAVSDQHFHVAGVRRRAIEHLRRPGRAAHDLAERRVFEVGQPGISASC